MIEFDFGLGEDIDLLREAVRSFASEEIAPRAEEIDLEIFMPGSQRGDQSKPPMRVTGRVIWTTSEPVAGLYPTGLMFLKLEDPLRRRIFGLVAALSG